METTPFERRENRNVTPSSDMEIPSTPQTTEIMLRQPIQQQDVLQIEQMDNSISDFGYDVHYLNS